MSWNYNNMRKSFGWKPKNNGPSFNNPQHPSNRAPNQPNLNPFPPSLSPAPWSSNQGPPPNTYNQGASNFMTQKSFPPSQPGFDNTFSTPYNNQQGNHRSLPPTNAQLNPGSKSNNKKTMAMVIVSVVVVIVALVGIFAGVAATAGGGNDNEDNNNNGNNDDIEIPDPADGIPLFPDEVRVGEDYVSVLFLTEPSVAGFNAFVRAARRWSDILAGSEAIIRQRQVTTACGNNFGRQIVTDHLRVFSSEIEIDGRNGVLGRAGFCDLAFLELPQFGNMEFDTVDINELGDNFVEAVILHEMGHVLGIGTLWAAAQIEIDPLPGDVRNPDLPQPFYIGEEGVAQFSIIKGSQQTQIAIENGFNDRAFRQGVNGAGPGSIGGHFDKDDLDNELMTFAISNDPRLSIITIGSLADLGYTINLALADPFVDPFPNQIVNGDAEGSKSEEDLIYLWSDILVDDKYSFVDED